MDYSPSSEISSRHQLLIYSPVITNRIVYVWDWICEEFLGLSYRITTDRPTYCAYGGPRINYSDQRIGEGELWYPAGRVLLEAAGIRPLDPAFFLHQGRPAAFPLPASGASLPFDLPALVFFLLTRYEEYLSFSPDRYGRFPAEASWAYRHGVLARPLLDEWLQILRQQFAAAFPRAPLRERKFRVTPGFDIDLTWAYRRRPFWIQGGGAARDLLHGDFRALGRRLAVLAGWKDDPYFVFPALCRWHREKQLTPHFFFLLGKRTRLDRNIPAGDRVQRRLFASLAGEFPCGLHPSYGATLQPGQLAKEVALYQAITGQAPVRSRQHFLLLRFPDTYRQLIRRHLGEDHTMGFPDHPGFRAGTCSPFLWFDLERNCTTTLRIHSFALMDVTLRQYRGYPPDEAMTAALELARKCREVEGVFGLIWHNSSFSGLHGWQGWETFYFDLMDRILPSTAE